MKLTRRQFNHGALAAAAAGAMPLGAMPVPAGFDDAYGRILGELCRIEEAAHLAGRASASGGASTW